VLDEATAGLDPETESKLLQSIRQNCAGGIIISHKIEPIKLCDEIIVFEDGRIIQRGNHEQLITEETGLYRKLFNLESK
jgi:ABC-type multidrug transport system fused ATPase/permease subunit